MMDRNLANLNNLNLLIFDLDGVITSEEKYWNTARLAVWDLLTQLGLVNYFGPLGTPSRAMEFGEVIISSQFIYEIKKRAINSNWDLTFFIASLHIAGILTHDAKNLQLMQINTSIEQQLQNLKFVLQGSLCTARDTDRFIQTFFEESQHCQGPAVFSFLRDFIHQQLSIEIPLFDEKRGFWLYCYNEFQKWYEGQYKYQIPGSPTTLAVDAIALTLNTLAAKCPLGIATGRPRSEVLAPLESLDLLHYFDPERIVTYDEVLKAESYAQEQGLEIKLGKPHPFPLLKSIYPQASLEDLISNNFDQRLHRQIGYVGDAASDILAAQCAGCVPIAVLTGFTLAQAQAEKRNVFSALGCEIILDSILELPRCAQLKYTR